MRILPSAISASDKAHAGFHVVGLVREHGVEEGARRGRVTLPDLYPSLQHGQIGIVPVIHARHGHVAICFVVLPHEEKGLRQPDHGLRRTPGWRTGLP